MPVLSAAVVEPLNASKPTATLLVTNDVAQGLSTPLAHAERMKTLWGNVLPGGHGEREMLAVPLVGERGTDTIQKVPKSYLTNILQARLEEIFELIAPFAGYGFNKAHASCYATIAFRTAYLKAHFPVEFMTALLTAESRGSTGPQKNEKISKFNSEVFTSFIILYYCFISPHFYSI